MPKTPTGIIGLDALTLGGLPTGRPSLFCGAAGCGKTLFALTFLVNGATLFGEPGVFVSFEERAVDLAANVASLGYDLDRLVVDRQLAIDYVRIEPSEIQESGDYDLEGLFLRIGHAIDSVGARRVVLDTIEALFSGLTNQAVLRAELRRLFAWLKDRGVTAIITAERAGEQMSRYGIEEYVSDCVILLDHRVQDQITTRRLRVVKYRGSAHGTNEYPFLIDDQGISVMPITSAGLRHQVSNEAISTGIAGLDDMLGPGGYYRGSSILISGLAGTGKSTFAAAFADSVCRRGEHCLFFAFEESSEQVMRNMRSVGVDLAPHVASGLLNFDAVRPSFYGFEMHLARMARDIDRMAPAAVVVDPISALRGVASDIYATLVRLTDICKTRGLTMMLTNLALSEEPMAEGDRNVSSLMDTWIALRDLESNGVRNRLLNVLKSRGMSHSKQVREYRLTDRGVLLLDAYVGQDGVLTGSARMAQEAREREAALLRQQAVERRRRELARERAAIEREIARLYSVMEAQEAEATTLAEQEDARTAAQHSDRAAMTLRRTSRP